ncbi:glycosidase [Sphingomonas sp. 1P06PA]|uniref:glycoside hydrolase family 130 protein n=1 Tax=Sphingomonas sp. 1P06PA TaxID=554121 RepID=UPI0039A73B28
MDDYLIFGPDDVDLARSPLRRSFPDPTFVLGAFNPGLAVLPSGNLLLMVRVAEALLHPIAGDHVRAVRWEAGHYRLDAHPLSGVDMRDPRQFSLPGGRHRLLALTSLSWLLPVELTPDGREIVAIHYDRALQPPADWACYGIEDARISRIDGTYWMTVCAVSPERHGTAIYSSQDGSDWTCHGLVLDHQNKDMILFEGRIAGRYWALTRPLGELYFAYPPGSEWLGGPSINLATSPDGLHWKPVDAPFIRPRRGTPGAMKVGGGSQPVLTDAGWMMIWHGVEQQGEVGVYRSFWSLLDRDDPTHILRMEDRTPLLEANPALTAPIADRLYLPSEVVFTTGIANGGDHWIVASGEADLACRITHIPKERFA